MKILILTTNTGSGHNSAAKAIQEEAKKRGIVCDIKNFMGFTSKYKERFVVDGHKLAYRFAPKTYGVVYNLIDQNNKSGQRLYKEYGKYADALKKYIVSHDYDTVIAVHIFAGLMLSQIKKKYDLNIKQYLVITDYTCSPGVAACDMDAWFVPKGLKDLFVVKGVDKHKIVESGIPCSKAVYDDISRNEAKARLGITDDNPLIFFCAGTIKTPKIERIAEKILNRSENCHLVILCGKNRFSPDLIPLSYDKRIKLLERTDVMALWMRAADVFISKAGGLTVTEAAGAGVPLILFDAIPGIEVLNRDFFVSHGCALAAESSNDLVRKTLSLMADETLKAKLIQNQKKCFPTIAVDAVMDQVIKDHSES